MENKTCENGWRCDVCGYVYEGAELQEDFICPVCGVDATEFVENE